MLQHWAAVISYVGSLLLLWPFVLVPGKKRKEKKMTTNKKTSSQPPQPVARNAEETQTACPRVLPVVQRAMPQAGAAQWESTEPGQTLQHGHCSAPRALLASPGPPPPPPGTRRRCHPASVCGELSTNLPAVLNYLNVPKLSTFNVHKYILLQNIVVYRPTTNIYVCVCVYTYRDVCVYAYRYTHKHKRVYICFLSILET